MYSTLHVEACPPSACENRCQMVSSRSLSRRRECFDQDRGSRSCVVYLITIRRPYLVLLLFLLPSGAPLPLVWAGLYCNTFYLRCGHRLTSFRRGHHYSFIYWGTVLHPLLWGINISCAHPRASFLVVSSVLTSSILRGIFVDRLD